MHVSQIIMLHTLNLYSDVCQFFFFKTIFKNLFIFREREREGEREGEKHQSVASRTPPTGDLAHNPDKYPDRESNQ